MGSPGRPERNRAPVLPMDTIVDCASARHELATLLGRQLDAAIYRR